MVKSSAVWLDAALILVLIITALAVRVPVAAERKVMPAGDAFNLQHIADFIAHGKYPPKENRLPGYPALLLLTRPLPVDPVVAGVGISLTLSSLMLACLYLTGRALQIHRIALLAFLGLSLFDPISIVSSVRPLSDATFLFFLSLVVLLITRQLAGASPPSKRNLLLIGAAITAMIFTRYEGYMVAAFTFPSLWLRRTWRELLIAAAIPFFAVLLWIPIYFSIHGSFTGGYIAELNKPSNNFAVASEVPTKFVALLQGAGWGNAWTIPASELEQEHPEKAFTRVVGNPAWWVSLLAILGAAWLAVKQRTKSLPLFLALAGYVTVLVWWIVYSRFVAPLIPFFYLTAAAGGSFVIYAVSREWQKEPRAQDFGDLAGGAGILNVKFRKKNRSQNLGALGLIISIFLGWILWTEAPRLHKQGLGRAWEGNQKGYALFNAVRQTAKLEEKTAFTDEGQAFATLYLKNRGFYLSRYTDETPEQIYEAMHEQHVQHVVEYGEDERLTDVVSLLKQRGNIKDTTLHRAPVWDDNSAEEVPVHHLEW